MMDAVYYEASLGKRAWKGREWRWERQEMEKSAIVSLLLVPA